MVLIHSPVEAKTTTQHRPTGNERAHSVVVELAVFGELVMAMSHHLIHNDA